EFVDRPAEHVRVGRDERHVPPVAAHRRELAGVPHPAAAGRVGPTHQRRLAVLHVVDEHLPDAAGAARYQVVGSGLEGQDTTVRADGRGAAVRVARLRVVVDAGHDERLVHAVVDEHVVELAAVGVVGGQVVASGCERHATAVGADGRGAAAVVGGLAEGVDADAFGGAGDAVADV